jgi:hypothetical protein
VRFSFELFPGGPGVEGDELDSLFLKAAAETRQIVKIISKTEAQFDAEAAAGLLPGPADEGGGLINIRHPADARAGAGYDIGGTAHVNVDAQAVLLVQQAHGPDKLVRAAANDLVDQFFRAGAVVNVPPLKGAAIDKSSGAYHFRKVFGWGTAFLTTGGLETFNQFPQSPVA